MARSSLPALKSDADVDIVPARLAVQTLKNIQTLKITRQRMPKIISRQRYQK